MSGLIFSQYFWPENFKINELVSEFSKKFDIEVLTSLPNYPKGEIFTQFKKNRKKYNKFNQIKIYRVPQISRGSGSKIRIFLNYLSFIFFSFIKILLLKKKYKFIFIFAPSPIISVIPAILLSKIINCKVYIWVLDLWPEVLKDLKIIRSPFILSIIDKVSMFVYKNSDKIFVQSESFKKIINKKLMKKNIKKKIITIYSWSDKLVGIKKNTKNIKKKTVFLFMGNIGQSQNLFLLVDSVRRIEKFKYNKFEFNLVGSGRMQENLRKYIHEKKLQSIIKLYKFKKLKELKNIINSSDVLYLSLIEGKFINSTIPAKFQTYLSIGKPILASIDGEVKNFIKKSKCGLVSSPKDSNDLKINIEKFLNMNNKNLKRLGDNSLKLSRNTFNKNLIIKKIIREIRN